MERNKARAQLPYISDAQVRQAETFRVEGEYHLAIAVDEIFTAKKGRCPTPEESARLYSAIQNLIHDSPAGTPEEQARHNHANSILDAELR